MQHQTLAIVSSAAGVVADQRTRSFSGKLVGIYFTLGDLASGAVDITVTDDKTGAAVLTITNAAANGWYVPQIPVYTTAGAAALFAAGGTALLEELPIDGAFKVAVAQAGNSHTGAIDFYVED